jgi:hypothetical protein
MGIILPLIIFVLVLTVVSVLILASNKRQNGNFWLWEQRRLRRSGLKGTALVLEKIDLPETWSSGTYFRPVEAIVEVSVGGRRAYRTSITRDVRWISGEMNKGETLPVCVDPQNEKRVIVDTDEMTRVSEARATAKRDAAEAEKRRLLGG